MGDKEWRLACVTGASSGIGEALCHLLAARGIALIVAGRNATRLRASAQEWSRHVPVEVVVGDLSVPEDLHKLIGVIEERAPDLVVNNAGFGAYGPFAEGPLEPQLGMVDVNVKALMSITYAAARRMQAGSIPGTILNVASAAAYQPMPLCAVYAATKAFVSSFSIGVAREMKEHGIHVLVSCPGHVATHFRRRAGGRGGLTRKYTMEASFVAKEILWQIDKGRGVRTLDWKYRIAKVLSAITPTALVTYILHKAVERRLM